MKCSDVLPLIFARVGSTRFPGKVVMPMRAHGKFLPMVVHSVKFANDIRDIFKTMDPIVLTTTEDEDKQIVEVVGTEAETIQAGIPLHCLAWARNIIKQRKPSWIMRILADNPFIDLELMSDLLKVTVSVDAPEIEYATYTVNDYPAIKTHLGLTCEIIKAEALNHIEDTRDNQEHITPVFYQSQKWEYASLRMPIPKELRGKDVNTTIDYMTDIGHVKKYGECKSWRDIAEKSSFGTIRRKP